MLYFIIIWCLFGSVGTLYLVYLIDKRITVKDVLWTILATPSGLIIFCLALYEYLKYNNKLSILDNFLDKVIIEKKNDK